MAGAADGDVLTPVAPTMPGAADADAIAQAAALISSARQPVLLLGLLASQPRAAQAVRALLAETKLPVVCTFQGAGVVPRELFDYFGGRVGLFHTQPADRLLDAADLVVAIGYNPVEYEPGLWNQGRNRQLVHIDAVAADIDRDYRPAGRTDRRHCGYASRSWPTQLGRKPTPHPRSPARTARRDRPRPGAIRGTCGRHERRADPPDAPGVRAASALSDDMTLCLDMGSFHIWLARHLYSFRARQVLISNGQQTLGVGLPWAIAACLVRPGEKVISISGDGGFLFSVVELETAVRLKCNLVHLVWIDGAYDMVRFQEVAKYGRASGVEFGPVDVVRLAEAFGAKGMRIETPDQISSTIKKALAIQGPVIVGVPVDYRDNHKFMEILHPSALN